MGVVPFYFNLSPKKNMICSFPSSYIRYAPVYNGWCFDSNVKVVSQLNFLKKLFTISINLLLSDILKFIMVGALIAQQVGAALSYLYSLSPNTKMALLFSYRSHQTNDKFLVGIFEYFSPQSEQRCLHS